MRRREPSLKPKSRAQVLCAVEEARRASDFSDVLVAAVPNKLHRPQPEFLQPLIRGLETRFVTGAEGDFTIPAHPPPFSFDVRGSQGGYCMQGLKRESARPDIEGSAPLECLPC